MLPLFSPPAGAWAPGAFWVGFFFCVHGVCVCARECVYVQNGHRILPPRLPQVRAAGTLDLVAPGSPALCAGSREARGPLSNSHPRPGPRFRAPDGPSASSPCGAAAALSAGAWDSDPGERRPGENLLKRRKSAERTGRPPPTPFPSRPRARAREAARSLSPGARPPGRPVPRPLTSTTEPRTASDTLCRSSAAVPGLLSRLVNLRTSAMAAAGRSRLACSLPRAGAAAAAAAPSVYSPAGHIAAWRRRVSRCSSLPPSAAPPSFPPSLPRSLAVRPHGGGRSLP